MELCLQKNTKKVGTPGLFQCTPKAENPRDRRVWRVKAVIDILKPPVFVVVLSCR